jgi:collagen type VII alpha
MSNYIGDFALGSTLDLKFTTRQITGAPFTLAGTPVVSAYVGNSTTQITAGITLSVDFDGVTGLNNVRVVATAANGYAALSNYQLVITTGTVNSVSVVGEVIGQFSINNRSKAGVIDEGTAQSVSSSTIVLRSGAAFVDDALNGCTVVITDGTQIGERAIITDYVGATDTATVTWPAATPSGTPTYEIYGSAAGASLAQIATAIWQDTTAGDFTTAGSIGKSLFTSGATPGATGGLFIAGTNAATTVTTALTTTFTGNLTGSVGSVTGAVGSVTGNVGGNVTGTVGSVVGAVGSVTGNVGGNVTGSVGSVAAGGITASSIATGAIDADALATDAVTEIEGAVWAGATRTLTAATNLTTALATPTNITAGTITTVSGNVTGSVGSVATGGITAASIATGAVDADAIAADGATKVAAAVLVAAAADPIDANIEQVNTVVIQGVGTSGDKWRPV